MLRKAILLLLTTICTSPISYATTVVDERCNVLFDLSQLHTMQLAYDFGKDHDLEWALAAIVWQESSSGKNVVNVINDNPGMKALSPFQILLRTAYNREGCKTNSCRKMVERSLMKEFDYSASHAVMELQYWNRKGKTLRDRLAHYYGGHRPDYNYASSVQKKIKYLKQCVRLEDDSDFSIARRK